MARCGTFLAALVFTTLVSYSYQLKCYECSASNVSRKVTLKPKNIFMRDVNADCGSFENTKLVQCPAGTAACLTLTASMGGAEVAMHGCGKSVQACSDVDGTTQDGADISCTSCTTDGCNGAAGTNVPKLQCYECTEMDVSRKVTLRPKNIFVRDINADCGSFESTKLVQCPASSECCTKLVGSLDGAEVAMHGCGKSIQACSDADGTTVEGVDMSCYSCTTDGCNGAAGMAAATSLLAITFLIAKFY